jgi:hypothetical protein
MHHGEKERVIFVPCGISVVLPKLENPEVFVKPHEAPRFYDRPNSGEGPLILCMGGPRETPR